MSARTFHGGWVALATAAALSLASCGGGSGNAGSGVPGLVTLLTQTVPGATTGVAYTAQFAADFPNAPGRFILTAGALPPGLSLDNRTGLLSGYPRQVGSFTFEVGARDGADPGLPPGRDANFAEDRRTYAITVVRGLPNILPQNPPAAQYRASYGYQIDIAGGLPPYVFSQIGGTMPTGITCAPSGFLGAFPTSETPGGEPYEFDIQVIDANGDTDTAHMSIDVVVLPLIILTTSPIQAAAANFPYSVTMQLASAGAGQPITWSQVAPGVGEVSLASIGMEITPQGVLRNASPNPGPTAVGTFLFTLRVTDEAGQATTRQYSFTVKPGPVLTSINPKKSIASPPFTLLGANFQTGALVIFKPGANQSQVAPSAANITPTTITLTGAPPTPGGGGGYVTVRVLNPDGGFADLVNAFAFPATNLTFNGTPVFPSPQSGLASTGLSAGDVDKDGFADFVHCGSQGSGSWSNAAPAAGGIHLMLNTPAAGVFNGTFNQVTLNSGGDWHGVKLQDVNTDGNLDVVAYGRVSSSMRIRTWLNPFPAAFTAATPFIDSTVNNGTSTSYHGGGIAFGRVSPSDSVIDAVYTIQQFPQSTTTSAWVANGGNVSSYQGAGNGSFTSQIQSLNAIYDHYAATDVALADFNGDGKDDMFVGDQAGGYMQWNWGGGTGGVTGKAALTNPATGLFGSFTPLTRSAGPLETVGVAVGDVNGDGNADIIAPTVNTWGSGGAGGTTGIGVFQGSGGFSFTAVTAPSASGDPRYAVVFDADFDFPGDVAVSCTDNKIDIFKGRTSTTGLQFRQTLTVTGSPRMGRVASGDFNGDGREDVIGAMSFYADARHTHNSAVNDRGAGSPLGVAIFLNTSN